MTYISFSKFKKFYVEWNSKYIVVTAKMLGIHFLPTNTRHSRLITSATGSEDAYYGNMSNKISSCNANSIYTIFARW